MSVQPAEPGLSCYSRNGFAFPIDVMTPVEAHAYRRRFEAVEARYGRLELKIKIYLVLVLADELVHHPVILDAVEQIIGPDILVWDADFIIKDAHDARYVSWHQDLTYWGLEPEDEVTAWFAFSPSTVENGCMRFAPGTHKCGIAPHVDTFAPENILSRGQELAHDVDDSGAVDVVLEPGQISLHDGRLIHSSRPNRTGERRIGLAIRYVPAHVRPVAGQRDSAMLVRGVDRHGHFDSESRAGADFELSQLVLQAAIEERRTAVLFKGAKPPATR